MHSLFCMAISVFLLLIGSTQGTWAQAIDLGTLPGGTQALSESLNDTGDVVGWSTNQGGYLRPFVVSTQGPQAYQMVDLGTLGGEGSAEAMDVSNSGLVVGYATTADGYFHAFAWSRKLGDKVDLGTLPDHAYSVAFGVGASGLIVGFSATADWSSQRPVAWTPDELGSTWTIHELSAEGLERVNGSALWQCWAVNKIGQIVGDGWDPVAVKEVPVIWNPVAGRKTWKPTKLEMPAEYWYGGAGDVNEIGQVVGFVATEDVLTPALWRPSGGRDDPWKLTVLPSLSDPVPPFTWNNVDGINNSGDLVGTSVDNTGLSRAVRWHISDLTTVHVIPGLPENKYSYARRVNEEGIAGIYYQDNQDYYHAAIVRIR